MDRWKLWGRSLGEYFGTLFHPNDGLGDWHKRNNSVNDGHCGCFRLRLTITTDQQEARYAWSIDTNTKRLPGFAATLHWSLVTHLLGCPGWRIPSGGNCWSSSRSASRWGSLERKMPILRLKIGVEGEGIQWSKIKIQSDTVAKWQRCHWLRYEMPFNLFRLAEASFGVLPDLPNFKGMGHGSCRWLLEDLASLKVECQTCKSNWGETKAAPKRVKGRLVWSTQVVGLSLSFHWIRGFCGWNSGRATSQEADRALKLSRFCFRNVKILWKKAKLTVSDWL